MVLKTLSATAKEPHRGAPLFFAVRMLVSITRGRAAGDFRSMRSRSFRTPIDAYVSIMEIFRCMPKVSPDFLLRGFLEASFNRLDDLLPLGKPSQLQ
jgi:hypothetical protein